uniref:NADH-ubiquinone oxidoreductase chain 5 n=1 Tax=Callionymus maculatus TaxID=508551 RepID=A0A7H1R6H8_9TELE|nr:NADH dehydrogenase subunit 5 [Callionymus maculatus]
MPYATEILTSSLLITLAILIMPLLWPSPIFKAFTSHLINTKDVVKLAFFMSILPLCSFINTGLETLTYSWTWTNFLALPLSISFKIDFYSIVFLPVALYVTWAILEFTSWYMASDPQIDRFNKYMLLFVIAMLTLVTANNLLQLFVGWEGVGIMSFLLISWWKGRADANTAALQAVLYNRIGDIGFILALMWALLQTNSWELDQIFTTSKSLNTMVPAFGLILAATGKSAQFGLHPWLPAAMEGPTPVSALLHSSTMVVAGIFLLIRMNPIIAQNPLAMSLCLWVGALTTVFSAICAMTQNDIKKIIAFSTSSQLGFMMVTIGLNQPQLAFLHICTHAFFKAMLFLCSGSLIHQLNDEQDIRKMGGLLSLNPVTTSCITLGSLALAGFPFLAGFFSKDTIIETLNTSYLNSGALVLTVVAASLTTAYSLRLIYFVSMNSTRIAPSSSINEDPKIMVGPIKRLAWGSILGGLIITANITLNKTTIMTMTPLIKMTALIVMLSSLMIVTQFMTSDAKSSNPIFKTKISVLSTKLGFFPTLMHRNLPKMNLSFAQNSSAQTIDLLWAEFIGPKALTQTTISYSAKLNNTQKGLIKHYLIFFMLAALTSSLVLLINQA